MVDLAKRRLFKRATLNHYQSDNLLQLPWLRSAATFTDDCTRCGQCLSDCETKIITSGDGGFPTVDFSIDECTFCYQCAESCPEKLFLEKDQSPWEIKAQISDQCLAEKKVECRSCGDSCEVQAIRFKLSAGRVAQPQIDSDSCNGCGACVSVCPTTAITVSDDPNNQVERDHYGAK